MRRHRDEPTGIYSGQHRDAMPAGNYWQPPPGIGFAHYNHAGYAATSLSEVSTLPIKKVSLPSNGRLSPSHIPQENTQPSNEIRTRRAAFLVAASLFVTLVLSVFLVIALVALSTQTTDAAIPQPSRGAECLDKEQFRGSEKSSLPSSTNNVCLTEDCIRLAANYINNMNTEVKPCDDFYDFACGRYVTRKVIAEHEKKITVLIEMKTGLDRHLRRILEGPRDNESLPLAIARTYYESCVDEAALDELDLIPLNSLISRLGGWPLLTNARFDSSDFHWEVLAGYSHIMGRGGLFRLFVHSSFTQSDQNMIMISPPRLLLEKRKYYNAPLESNQYLQKYKLYMLEFLELLGAEREAVEPQIDNILLFEMHLANATQRDSQRNHSAINNAVKLGEFKARHGKISWDLFFNDEIRSYLSPLNDDTVVNIIDPTYFDKMTSLLTGSRMQFLANILDRDGLLYDVRTEEYLNNCNNDFMIINDYIMWKLISSLDEYLPRRYRMPAFKFRSWLSGASEEPTWEGCVRLVRAQLGPPLASAYAHKYFSTSDREQAVEMINDLKASMEQTLLTADWMDDTTRAAAILKLEHMGHKVGFPDWLFNETYVLKPYTGVKLVKKRLFDNAVALEKAAFREMLTLLHQPRKSKDLWVSSIIAVDAFHYFNANEIIFPAGILQFPMFVPDAPSYVNYGAIGMGIGHEITHGYDDLGAQYDGSGNLRGWWRPDTMRVFHNKKQCFIAQYSAQSEPITNRKLDGRLTVGENIADNGGLRVAYGAYNIRSARRPQPTRLPALGNFTDHQMFFIAYANTWCEKVRPSAVNYILDTDVHSLGRFRVNVPLQNFPAFSNAFDCPIGAPMNPFEKCRIW